MNNFEQQHAIWNEFLETWPLSRLKKMTLEEYTRAGSQDSFTYWLESRLDKMGSYWGGSSFKFGVFSRNSKEEKQSEGPLSYSSSYGWYSSLGDSAEAAFEQVRDYVVKVATLAREGNLEAIQSIEQLGRKLRWKIAFHYQDRNSPKIVNVFTEANLAAYAGLSADRSMAHLQKEVMKKRSTGMDLLEFGQEVWESSQRNLGLEIWKLSHGGGNFSSTELQQHLKDKVVLVHQGTLRGQGRNFVNASEDTLFFLCHGNSLQLIGQFTSEAMSSNKGDGWLQRKYSVLLHSKSKERFTASGKGWSPKYNSTFMKVKKEHLPEFEVTLLKPFFGKNIRELNELVERPVKSRSESLAVRDKVSRHTKPCTNRIYYGPPGTGKTYELINLLKKGYGYQSREEIGERCSFVTFHQSYGYEEFVEGLRPLLESDESIEDDTAQSEGSDVKYEIRPGVFKKLCDLARNSENRFAMVIDEINRGNISKIFGELITLIEPDKREGGNNAINITLPYSGKDFSIPPNVDIYGTMNTADRSLTTLDTALRRRFEFIPLRPDSSDKEGRPLGGLRVNLGEQEINIPEMLTMINARIETLYDRDHCIGHAYFMSLRDVEDGKSRLNALADIFKTRVMPLLEEYFFEDWQKIRLVLADNQKSKQFQFITASDGASENEDKLRYMFGREDIDAYATKKIFQIQEIAFDRPNAYIGIYGKA